MSLMAALERIITARRAVHDEVCIQKDRFPCIGCPSVQAIARSLDALDVKASDVRSVRRALHDAVCVSGCSDDDHANRTQAKTAAALCRFHRSERAA